MSYIINGDPIQIRLSEPYVLKVVTLGGFYSFRREVGDLHLGDQFGSLGRSIYIYMYIYIHV